MVREFKIVQKTNDRLVFPWYNMTDIGGRMSKVSIRFFNDREVRAIWDEENAKWWFSVLDIVGVLNGQDDYEKNRNYWKYLKAKLKKAGNQLGSVTTQFKLTAADGKKYKNMARFDA
jgi:cell filamentation protein